MDELYYIGLDLHKKIIAYCIKTVSGVIVSRGTVAATRSALLGWVESLPQTWVAAMEATMFTGWVYDFLKPHAKQLIVAHPEMLNRNVKGHRNVKGQVSTIDNIPNSAITWMKKYRWDRRAEDGATTANRI